MYRKILLAYDGSVEGRRALREGATLALKCKADVFLFAVIDNSAMMATSDGTFSGIVEGEKEEFESLLLEGVQRLEKMGFQPEHRLGWGQPAEQIVKLAKEINADLVVVGHRHKSPLERWWSGSVGGHLLNNLRCSLLIGQNEIDDSAFSKIIDNAD